MALVGGATGLIGDPSFKASERTLNSAETVQGWVASLSAQISALLPASDGLAAPLLVNNADWMGQMSALDFLRDIGKHFSVNAMLARESVRQRLARPDQGISFTEFSYALLQSQDFAVLNQRLDCTLQIGGNDQWGNITSGMDLTRRLHQTQVYGMTLPLITKADGTKFGKTEGALSGSTRRSPPPAFYQFWLGTADEDVYRFLRYYSFMPLAEIEALEAEDAKRQGRKLAQQVLADELTAGARQGALAAAQRISESLFSGEVARLGRAIWPSWPGWHAKQPHRGGNGSGDPAGGVRPGQLEADRPRAAGGGAVSVNGAIRRDEPLTADDRLFGRYLLLRRGKKQYHLVICS